MIFRRLRSPEGEFPWPVRIEGRTPAGDLVRLRPLRVEDEQEYLGVRRSNHEWLAPWDATSPRKNRPTRTFAELVDAQAEDARAGRALPLVIDHGDRLVGQVNVSNITRGSFWSCSIGYWISRSLAGRAIVPTAVALVGDHCLSELQLHRIEINIRPENGPSLRVVEKLGLRDEGVRERYLHIQGEWRDHRTFAVTSEEVPDGLLARWQATRRESI